MNKRRTMPLLAMSASAILGTIGVGYGDWIINSFNERNEFVSSPAIPVAKIGSKKYTSISKAIKSSKSGDTVEVIVPSDLKRTKNRYEISSIDNETTITIPKGVTFLIPYQEGTRSNKKSGTITNNHSFDNIDTYCKNLVIVSDGVTLINNGTIEVGGELSSNSGWNPTGCTSGNFAKIILGDGAELINHGTINLFGLITEKNEGKSKLIVQPGEGENDATEAIVNMPMYWYDFSGGTALKKAYDAVGTYKCFPLTDFYFENITPKTYFYYGSTAVSWINIYASRVHGQCDLPLITKDDSGLIQFVDKGTYVICDYDPKTLQMDLSFYGGCTFNNLVVDLKAATGGLNGLVGLPDTITTATGFFPVSYHYNVALRSIQNSEATYTAPSSSFKFMNGSSLLVDQSTTLKLNGLVCYENFDYYTDCKWPGKRHVNLNDAMIQNNGVIKVNDSAGSIKSSKADSIFALSNSASFTMYEPKNSDTDPIEWFAKQMTLSMPSETGEILTGVGKYTSIEKNSNYYWKKSEYVPDEITISIDSKDGFATGEEQEKTFAIFPKFSTSYYGYDRFVYNWTVSNGAYFKDTGTTTSSLYNPELYIPKNSGSSDVTYKVNLNVKFADESDSANTKINEIKPAIFTAKKPGCVLPTALVLMADGSYKKAGLICTGDMVMSFNHETGVIEPNVVIGNDDISKPAQVYDVVHLEFGDGKSTDFIDEHGYFDVTLNKYVYLHIDDAKDYVGHEFVAIDEGSVVRRVKLVSVSVVKTFTKLCSPATANSLNIVADGMLSIAGGLTGLFNIFDYDLKTLAFDKEKMEADIRKYGLLTYKDFERFFPEEIYNLLPCKYLGVSIGKGLIGWGVFEGYVKKWKDQLMENVR